MECKGIIVPILTPMNADESINYGELKNQINRMIDAGIHGIFFFGTNGEAYILTPEEKCKILEAGMEAVDHRVPVYAGTGCIGTKDTIEMSKAAESLGADVLSIISPYFAAVGQDELYTHYKRVAESVKTPIVVYNIPARTGVNIAPATVEKLSHIDNIVGVKDSSGNFDNMLQYIEAVKYRKDFSVLSGNDSLILWCLLAGGKGSIAGCANVCPHNMAGIYESFIKGEMEQAKIYQNNIRPLRNTFKFGNPNTLIKKATELLGYPVGPCRAPFNSISTDGIEALKKVLAEYKESGIN